MQPVTIGIAFAFYVVWMQRQKRWALTWKALTGEYVLAGTRGTAAGQGSSGPGITPQTAGQIFNPVPTPQPSSPFTGPLTPGANIGGGTSVVTGPHSGVSGLNSLITPTPQPAPQSPVPSFLIPGTTIG